MFKKSNSSSPPTIFSGISQHMSKQKIKRLDNPNAWHNCFHKEITSRIDEDIFSPLYSKDNGRPNASVRILVAMLILKDGNDWTDEQLFEACNFNILVGYALGLSNLSDNAPSEATYYNFKVALLKYEQENGINLLEKCFQSLTKDQIFRYQVSGGSVRMDSKLIHSNVAKNTRLQLCVGVMSKFYKSLKEPSVDLIDRSDKKLLDEMSGKTVEQYTYRLDKKSGAVRLELCGRVIYRLMRLFSHMDSDEYKLLERLWNEHFERIEEENDEDQTKLKDKQDQSGSTLQSAHDAEAAYRKKSGSKTQIITGYVTNVTETCAVAPAVKPGEEQQKPLNLITDVQTEKATFSDDKFFIPAIINTRSILNNEIENVLSDGAYNSVINEQFSNTEGGEFEWFVTAIQGVEGNYDFEKVGAQQYRVTDRRDGKTQLTVLTEKGKYRINDNYSKTKYRYLELKAITNYFRRKKIKEYPQWVHSLRANSESTIHQVFCKLDGAKSKYRGLFKHHQYAINRCFWTNFRRILGKRVEMNEIMTNTLIGLFTFITSLTSIVFRFFLDIKTTNKILYCSSENRHFSRGF